MYIYVISTHSAEHVRLHVICGPQNSVGAKRQAEEYITRVKYIYIYYLYYFIYIYIYVYMDVGLFVVDLRHSNSISVISWQWYYV